MAGLNDAFERANLERAWRWIRSNPDAMYKRFCGESYTRFAAADDLIIDSLYDRLRRGIYEPNHACKLLVPKASGLLRPYTLLTVEDQIVYQALVNVIAESLSPRIRNRYLVQTFGHLYAGKTSTWFYRRWADGYAAFNKAARAAFKRGLVFTATFDLTACYDSLDHQVLCHFLLRLGCTQEFCQFLIKGLRTWTATSQRIHQSHGIPQGPLGSGLIAETVLQHFDQHTTGTQRLVYLRYVDDIRLFAAREVDLRRRLVRLDELSKDLGLFPQAGKIDIHQVTDIEAELKSVSQPTDSFVRRTNANQDRIRRRIVELTPRLTPQVKIANETRFKFVLAHAQPSSKINSRLLIIARARPDLTSPIVRYFQKYQKLPKLVVDDLLARVRSNELYEHVTSQLIALLSERVDTRVARVLNTILKRRWRPKGHSPDLTAVIGKRLIETGQLTLRQTEYALRAIDEWWVRVQLTTALGTAHYGRVALETILNRGLRDAIGDVSIAAAERCAGDNIGIQRPYRTINPSGGKVLRQYGVLSRAPGRSCGIEFSLTRLTLRASTLRWRSVFGTNYRQAEKQAVHMRALADTNVTAFVNAADVFNDLLLAGLYAHDQSLGVYAVGNIGSVLNSARLRAAYPQMFVLCNDIHRERLRSMLSHPRVRATGRPTNRIPYRYLGRARSLYRAAVSELERLW